MAKLHEHLDQEGKKIAVKLVEDIMLAVVEYRNKHAMSATQGAIPRRMDNGVEYGETVARYVHGQLMTRAKPHDGLPGNFTHLAAGESVSELVERTGGGMLTREQSNSMAAQMLAIMRANHVGDTYADPAIRGEKFVLAQWPVGSRFIEKWWGTGSTRGAKRKYDAKTEERIEEEKDKPVTSVVDIKTIALPDDPTPRQLVAYVRKLAKAFERQGRILTSEQSENAELRQQLQAALDGSVAEAAQDIKSIVDGVAV